MGPQPKQDSSVLKRQVADAERAFARTMAERDHKAFRWFLSHETVFFSGPEWWKRYYAAAQASFSWEPAEVEVLESGTLAISSGLEQDGKWRVIFDKGNPVWPPKP